MRVVVHVEDLSPRKDDGYYSKPDLASALDILFRPDAGQYTLDADGEDPLGRDDAEGLFKVDGQVTFFNEDGERIVITRDPSASDH